MQSMCFIPVAFAGESWRSLNSMKITNKKGKKKKIKGAGVSALNCPVPTFCDKV